MLNIDEAGNNVKQMLYVFRYFYSNAFKFNIAMHSDDWNLPDNIKNSDIIGLLKKDINILKYKYIPDSSKEDAGKLKYAEDKMNELLKLKFDDNKSLVDCFYIAYKALKTLSESKQYLITKWFVVSFFEKYLPVTFKAYDIYKRGQNEIIIGVKDDLNGISKITTELIDDKKNNPMTLSCYFYMLCNYILSANKNNGYVNRDVLGYVYMSYLLDKDEKNQEAANQVELSLGDADFRNILDKFKKDNGYVANDGYINSDNDPIILDTTNLLGKIKDSTRLQNIIRQTMNSIKDNEGDKITFNIPDDFKMYFTTSKEEFRPVFVKSLNNTYTLISHGDNIYLLYTKENTPNVYGISLVNWFNEPSSLVKIEPDSEGKFEFVIDNLEIDV